MSRETSSLMRNAMLYHCQTNVRILQLLPDSGLSAYGQAGRRMADFRISSPEADRPESTPCGLSSRLPPVTAARRPFASGLGSLAGFPASLIRS
jgi:hypothetical protein